VLTTYPLPPGTIVLSRPLGVMKMIDGDDRDNKIIAAAVKDPANKVLKTIDDVNPHLLKEIQNFFETYKVLEGKKTKVEGFGNAEDAKKEIMDSIELYNEKFDPEF